MRRNLLPSVEIEKEIEALLAAERVDVHPLEVVSELGRLGVRLVVQRAVEEEVDDWLGRARYERRAEATAAACLADDLDALTVRLRYPFKHRRVWRSTNLLEGSLGEVKRRTKVIGRFPGESSCLSPAGPCSTSSSPAPTASASTTSTGSSSNASKPNRPATKNRR